MKVYQEVRAYLESHGIKQKAVAQKVGIPAGTFNAILNGKRTMYAEDLRAICLALNVSPELFVNTISDSKAEDKEGTDPKSVVLVGDGTR